MLAMCHDDARQRDALLVLHRVSDHDECLRSGLAVRRYVIGFVEIPFVDLGPRHEALNVDRMCALYLNRFQLVLVNFHVLALGKLVAAPFMRGIDRAARLLVDHLLAQTVPGLRVDLVKMRFLALRSRRK
jgi:hypothetical protein